MSLDAQEDQCRTYCQHQGLKVARLFREEGESAKTANRPELTALLRYCEESRKNAAVDYVVVYSVDRFARSQPDHFALRATLAKFGTQLRSVTQPINESPEGQLMEGVFASVSQYDNAIRSRRTRTGLIEGATRGRWMWRTPIGYLKGEKGTMHPDPERAPWIAYAFEKVASGEWTQAQVLDEVTALGLVDKRGRGIKKQQLQKILTSPVYAGRVVSSKLEVDVPGIFEPVVSPESYAAVQDVLAGRRSTKPSRHLDNPEFPLRRIVRCGRCGTPMTGSTSTARNKSKHSYYRCRKAGCRGTNVRRERFHELFEGLLQTHVVRPEVLDLFVAEVESMWEDRNRDARDAHRRLEARLGELEAKEVVLVDKLTQGSLTDEEFRKHKDRIDEDMRAVRVQLTAAGNPGVDLIDTLRFARSLLGDLPAVWNRLEWKKRPAFLRAMYPSGLIYSEGAIGTTELPWLLAVLPTAPDDLSALVPPTGFEPVLPP